LKRKRIEIDGRNFSNLKDFYDEVEQKFTFNLGWKIGRNLDAFNDIMRGGFDIFDYGEDIEII